jgi:hypothetical protein
MYVSIYIWFCTYSCIYMYIYKMYDILYTYPLYIYIQQVFHPFEAQRCDRFTAQRWPAFHATKSSMADHGINSDPAWNWKATGALYILYRDIHISYLHTYIYSIHYNVSTYFWKALPPAQQKKLKTTVLQVGRAPHKALAFFSRVGASSLGGCMEWQCYNAIFICIIKLSITKTIYICYKLYISM